MTDSQDTSQSLGVGTLLNDTFSIYFRNLHWFAALAFGPTVVDALVSVALGGTALLTGQFDLSAADQIDWPGVWNAAVVVIPVYMISAALTTAMITSAAYDARLGRSMRIGIYVSLAAKRIVPVVLCSVIAMLCVYAGFVFMFIPGLWVVAVYFVLIPVVAYPFYAGDAIC